jgi:hypothetical protein
MVIQAIIICFYMTAINVPVDVYIVPDNVLWAGVSWNLSGLFMIVCMFIYYVAKIRHKKAIEKARETGYKEGLEHGYNNGYCDGERKL